MVSERSGGLIMKIFVQVTESELATSLQALGHDVEYYAENIRYRDLEEKLNQDDIVFWDQIPPHGFYGSKAHVILMTATSTDAEEYAAAKAGALAYIPDNLPEHVIGHVIKSVSKGETWITRHTIARMFDEYVKSMDNKGS